MHVGYYPHQPEAVELFAPSPTAGEFLCAHRILASSSRHSGSRPGIPHGTVSSQTGERTKQADGPLVFDPERAVLELLSDIGVRQPLQEARDLLEGAPFPRAAALQELLARCKAGEDRAALS